MDFLGDMGPNYNGGLVRWRTHRFKWPSLAPSVPLVVVGGRSGCSSCESVHVSLSVGVQQGETRINTGSKCISASAKVKAKRLLSVSLRPSATNPRDDARIKIPTLVFAVQRADVAVVGDLPIS